MMQGCNQSTPGIIISLLLAGTATMFMTIALATDYWEVTEFSSDILRQLNIDNSSVLNDTNGYYKVIIHGDPSVTDGPAVANSTPKTDVMITMHLRAKSGGIWRICDRITASYRETLADTIGPQCFTYIPDYKAVKHTLDDSGIWLVRMQNSAASCFIVTLLCLFTAVITGAIGLLVKQVSACMVTGVMYIVAGTFGVFGLVIMHTKISFMQSHCRSLDPLPVSAICSARLVSVGWSLPLAWVSFAFCICAFIAWLFLSRCLRLEKSKTII